MVLRRFQRPKPEPLPRTGVTVRNATPLTGRDHGRSGSRDAMFVEIQYHSNSRLENLDRLLPLVDLDDLENAIAVAFGQVVEILGLGTPWSGRNDQACAHGSSN